MAINFFALQLMFEELPFLQEFVDAEIANAGARDCSVINEVLVKIADQALLDSKAIDESYSSVGGGYNHYTRVFALQVDEEGYTNYSFEFIPEKKYGSGGENHTEEALTIGEQMAQPRFKKPHFFVVCEKQDSDFWGRGDVVRRITIYKAKKFDLQGYFARKIDDAARKLKDELASLTF